MGWDDFLGEVQDLSQSDVVQDVNQYLQDNPSTLTLVKQAAAQSGNQTAQQLAAGLPGGAAPIAAPSAQGAAAAALAKNAGSGLFGGAKVAGFGVGTLLLIGVAAYFVLGKKGRK